MRTHTHPKLPSLTCGTACLGSPSAVSDSAHSKYTFVARCSLLGVLAYSRGTALCECQRHVAHVGIFVSKGTCLPTLRCTWACVSVEHQRSVSNVLIELEGTFPVRSVVCGMHSWECFEHWSLVALVVVASSSALVAFPEAARLHLRLTASH